MRYDRPAHPATSPRPLLAPARARARLPLLLAAAAIAALSPALEARACDGSACGAAAHAGAARASAPEATRNSAASIAERAARAGGGRAVHEVDGRVIVRGGGEAAAAAVRAATGAGVVRAGAGAVRLTASREAAALAALDAGRRNQLLEAVRGLRARMSEAGARDAIDVRPSLLEAELTAGAGAARAARATSSAAARAAGAVAAAARAAVSSAASIASSVGSGNSGAGAATAPAPLPGAGRRPGFFDTSEFLAGRIAVNVVFVESTRAGRPWSREDREDALADLVEGLDMWALAAPRAKLVFRYRTHRTTTPLQPIEASSERRDEWIGQAMSQLGVSAASAETGWRRHYLDVYELNNRARRELGTDWAFTVFFVRAANRIGEVWDAATDGLEASRFTFADGQHPFTMLGGPYMVMPFSKVWGVHFWNAPILSHEFGHVFYALDEYAAYAAQGHAPSERAGYFDVENGNLRAAGARSDVSCIMRGSLAYTLDYVLDHIVRVFTFGHTPSWSYSVCGYTKGQMGYRDADGNGRIDTFDAAPSLAASGGISSGAAGARTLSVSVEAAVGAAANRNAYGRTVHPAEERRHLSIDSVAKLLWRVDGGAWREARPPVAGAPGARFSLSLALPSGTSSARIELEVVTEAGARASRTITARTPVVLAHPDIAARAARIAR
jgi:hypothetical protein